MIHTYMSKRKLTKEMVDAFVDSIIIHGKYDYEIKLVYDDQFAELQKDNEREGGTVKMTENRKTAVYIRLSMEDENVDGRTKLESDSVTSQRILLKSFVIDQLGVDESDILEYVDDGVSGTHFKRNGFQQLQEDMKSGQIGCVVVKDFSRFGRDYLEVGFYIEYIFPLLPDQIYFH